MMVGECRLVNGKRLGLPLHKRKKMIRAIVRICYLNIMIFLKLKCIKTDEKIQLIFLLHYLFNYLWLSEYLPRFLNTKTNDMKRILMKASSKQHIACFPFMKHAQIHKILQNRKNVDVSIEYATCFYEKNKCFFSVHTVCCTNMVYDHCRPTARRKKNKIKWMRHTLNKKI